MLTYILACAGHCDACATGDTCRGGGCSEGYIYNPESTTAADVCVLGQSQGPRVTLSFLVHVNEGLQTTHESYKE